MLKKEAAKARLLREAEAARQHNAALAAGGPGIRKHVLIPEGDTHTCEECGLQVPTGLRARNLEKPVRGKAPEGKNEEEIPPEERHILRKVKGNPYAYECEKCLRRDRKKRLLSTRCREPGVKMKS